MDRFEVLIHQGTKVWHRAAGKNEGQQQGTVLEPFVAEGVSIRVDQVKIRHPIAFLHPGQPATIKLTAYDFAIFGGLEAELDHISADTITDDDDNTFYLVRVRTVEGEQVTSDIQVIPGMTAQVDIMTGKRTVMEYMLKPVLRAWDNALGER
jgi:adhesin transport system membrane fusion protein